MVRLLRGPGPHLAEPGTGFVQPPAHPADRDAERMRDLLVFQSFQLSQHLMGDHTILLDGRSLTVRVDDVLVVPEEYERYLRLARS